MILWRNAWLAAALALLSGAAGANNPTVTTNAATGISATGATLNGTVSDGGLTTKVYFNYGTTDNYGTTVTYGDITGSNRAVAYDISGLVCNTTYHFRVRATNADGTRNGHDRTFTTTACPIAEYRFDGATPGDSSGNNLNGTLVGGMSLASGKVCSAFNFNGSNAYVSVPDSNILDITSNITIAAWVRHTASTFKAWEAILTKGDTAYRLHLYGSCNPNGTKIASGFTLGLNGGCSDADLDSNTVPVADRWYHVAATYDRATMSIYVDGTRAATANFNAAINANTIPLYIGENAEQPGRYWAGDIDEVKIWSTTLSAAEIAAGYANENAGKNWDGSVRSCPLAYDHLEIQHDGASTLCPDNVTVLACTVATVPCPTANQLNAGTLTGNLTVTPATPAVTIAPTSFTLGAAGTMAVMTLQGSGAETYTLGATNLSTVPMNGVKCYNTASHSENCAFAISNTPCAENFECMATGVAYTKQESGAARNPLYTKLAGADFKFDVLALKADGTLSTTYAAPANLKVELFDDGASPQPACSDYTSPIATQSLTFATTDSGRKTLPNSITVANAYPKVRCRVTDSNTTPAVVGCSSDDFAIRPSSLSIGSDMTADLTNGSNATATPTLKAGASFQLTATGVTGYNGTPAIDNTKILAHSGAIAVGAVTGGFSAAAAATGIASGPTTGFAFGYSEVGYFRFDVDGVYDSTFTSIDQAGDCTNDFSNTLVGGKYGCKFGNTAITNYFGRFIPDHFDTTVTQGCAAGSFTYSAQPFKVDVTARNSAGVTTQNYDKGTVTTPTFSKAATLSDANSATNNSTTLGTLANTAVAAATFDKGVASVSTLNYTFNSKLTAPLRTVTGSAPLKVHATEPATADGVTSSGGAEGTTPIRAGRLRLSNVYGYKSPLSMPVEAQYWTGSSWIRNSDDTCTTLATGNLSVSSADWSATAISLSAGTGSITLKPTAVGSTTVCADLSTDPATGVVCSATSAALPWLQSRWPPGANYDNDPSATATFGVFSPEGRRGVYSREMY